MKKITFTILACLLWFSSFSQWNSQTSGTTDVFTSVYFTDVNNGYAVAFTNVYLTSDAGNTWTLSSLNQSNQFNSVSFGDDSTGCVVGVFGTVYYTTDSGSNWSQASPVSSSTLRSVFFIDADTAFAVGDNGTIIKSVNGGMSWTAIFTGINSSLNSVYFTNDSTGYTVGASGNIFKTINWGANWTQLSSGTPNDLFSVYFTNATTGYASGANGTILKTSNAGLSWAALPSGTTNTLNSIHFAKTNINVGYAVGAVQKILKTNDAGATWYTQTNVTSDPLNAVFFIDENIGYTVGGYGKILKTTNGGCVSPTLTTTGATAICAGTSTNLYVTGASTYVWSPATGLNCTNCANVNANPTTDITYSISGTSLQGCTNTTAISIIVNQVPIVNLPANITVCDGMAISPTTFTSIPSGASYTWTNSTTSIGLVSSGIGNISFFTGTNSTSSPVTAVISVEPTLNGCTGPQNSYSITVNPLPFVNTFSTASSICLGSSVTLTSSGTASTYTWSGGVFEGVSFMPSVTNTYTVTGTDANSCTNSAITTVTVNSIPVVNASSTASSICPGSSVTFTSSGTASSYTWSGGVIEGTNLFPSVTDTYTVTGTDANLCTNTAIITVTVLPLPVANAGPDTAICLNDSVLLTGTGGFSYVWTGGSNTYQTPTIYVSPNAPTTYTLTVIDNNGCTASDDVLVAITPNKDLYGHVDTSGVDIINGTVVLLKHEPFLSQFDTIQVASLNSSGDYYFPGINQGTYLIKVFADPISYPTLIPTYNGNDFLWNGSGVIITNHTCTINDTSDISMMILQGTGGGIGLISGQISEGPSFGRAEGGPIPGVDVKLGKNPGGSIMATTSTSGQGYYSFSGVANGNYTVYVDIPGLGRDSSYTFTVDSENNQFLNLDYTADSTSIYINPNLGVGINSSANIIGNNFHVYPNPVIENTTIEYTIIKTTEAKTTLEVYNLLGVKISSLVNEIQKAGNYKYNFNPQNNNLNSGVYFISLTIDGKTITKRIVVME